MLFFCLLVFSPGQASLFYRSIKGNSARAKSEIAESLSKAGLTLHEKAPTRRQKEKHKQMTANSHHPRSPGWEYLAGKPARQLAGLLVAADA